MPNVTGGRGSFGGSAQAGRDASNTGTGRSSAERQRAADLEKRSGFTTTIGPDGRPVFTSISGLSQGISVSPSLDKMKQTQERAATYNAAAGEWNKSARQRSLANFANKMAPMGFSMEAPDINRPATFSGGTYHLGWNPGAFAGGLIGGMAFPGGGIPGGFLGGMAYDATGLGNVMVSGPGKMGMQNWDAPGLKNVGSSPTASPSAPSQGGSFSPFSNGNTGGGSLLLPSVAQTPQLAAAQQAAAPAPSAPAYTPFSQTTIGPKYNLIPGPMAYGWMFPGYSYASVPK